MTSRISRERLRALRKKVDRRRGLVRFGSFAHVDPVSRSFGYDRGEPVDRYYIEGFLADHAADVRGRVLEVGDATYTRRFGGDAVETADVLHIDPNAPEATIIGDIAEAEHIPSAQFDCLVFTQTLHLVWDVHAAVRTLHRILKPGGVALVTVPTISQRSDDVWSEQWYWSMTDLATERLFGEVFGAENTTVRGRGNVFAATAFLQGLSWDEVPQHKLDHDDPQYHVLSTVRAVRRD
jgi:SAM-dependent methyltransferase